MSNFSLKESVLINGKQVSIRVRDRTQNLLRVRVHHFKFNDDLGLLLVRLRQYGTVNRIFWDTYQDKQLPKWSGIKTGVVNVDMEIHDNIPSYINFGSYKHPLMVEYAGQMKTCRLCDSQLHVSSTCPKLTHQLGSKTLSKPVAVARSYSSVAAQPAFNKPSTSGWQTKTGGKYVPIEIPDEVASVSNAITILDAALNQNLATRGSTPEADVQISDEEDGTNDEKSGPTEKSRKKRKKSATGSKQLRDQEKQAKRVERRGSDGQPPEKAQVQSSESEPVVPEPNEGNVEPQAVQQPEQAAPRSSAVAEGSEAMEVDSVSARSTPANDELTSTCGSSDIDIPAGQRPRDDLNTQESLPPVLVDINTPECFESTDIGMEAKTIEALEKFRQKKAEQQKSRSSTNKI